MLKQLTLRVRYYKPDRYDAVVYASYGGQAYQRDVQFIRRLGLRVPKEDYRVRFTRSPMGQLVVGRDGQWLSARAHEWGGGYVVCFLRYTGWPEGTRVKRTVLPW